MSFLEVTSTTTPYDAPGGAEIAVLGFFGLMYLSIAALSLFATVRVSQRAGYSGWWAVLAFVPMANFIVMLLFAFKEWPIERELAGMRRGVQASAQQSYPQQAFSQPAYPQPAYPQPAYPPASGPQDGQNAQESGYFGSLPPR